MKLSLLASAAVLGLSAAASAREEGASANSLGLADAVRSSAVGPAALYFNPAAMHQFMQYAVESGYEYSQPLNAHTFSVSVVDSATNAMLAMGIGYSYIYGHELYSESARSGHNLRFGAASGFRGEGYSIHAGVSGRYLSLSIGDDGSAEGITMDTGILLVVQNMFRLGIVGHHLIDTGLAETPRQMGIGASVYLSAFLLAFDTVLDFETASETTAQYRVGMEYAIGERVPLRLGYENSQLTGDHAITGGIGFVSRLVAVDFGFRQSLVNNSDNVFSLNVRGFVP